MPIQLTVDWQWFPDRADHLRVRYVPQWMPDELTRLMSGSADHEVAAKQAAPAKPTPVIPRVFGNDLDLFSVGAHDLADDEVGDNKYIVYVKPGEEDEEFPRQAIEGGVPDPPVR